METVTRLANIADLPTLLVLESSCFDNDRLSKRRFKHWIEAENGICIVACHRELVVGYGLVILRSGSRSARLYSLAIDKSSRGQGCAQILLLALEKAAVDQNRLFMRLEVAENNTAAILLYTRLAYKKFGVYLQYYADGSNAMRMQKSIKQNITAQLLPAYPWYQQSTEFTCGPAALMMAMQHLQPHFILSAEQEIDIWRQATTVFMTSGHGGCHPIGLALAAHTLGFEAEVYISQKGNLFVDGVRSQYKKSVMQMVEQQFFKQANKKGIKIQNGDYINYGVEKIKTNLEQGHAVICLISTFQFDSKKAPHWVAITHIDDSCLYFHDPDASLAGVEKIDALAKSEAKLFQSNEMDYQHVPIVKEDFVKLSVFGKSKLRTCVVVRLQH